MESKLGALDALPEITSMGVQIFDPIWRKEHVDKRCELLYIRHGRVDLALGNQLHSAGVGDTLVVPSGVPHRDVFDLESDFEVFMVTFKWRCEEAFWRVFDNNLALTATASLKAETGAIFDRLRDDLGQRGDLRWHVSNCRCLNILLLLAEACVRHQAPKTPDDHASRQRGIMLKARKYIDEHFNEFIALGDIADALGISPFYLSRVFSRECNFSLVSYLTTLRMNKARALLLEGAMNVSEVAFAVGYDDSGYFSKVFKRHFDMKPSELGKQG